MQPKCKYCQEKLPPRKPGRKPLTFCNKSCSRKHYCENNKEKVVEANRKGYQTLKENNPEVITHRGRSTEKKRAAIQKMKDEGHYGGVFRPQPGDCEKTPEQIEKWKETYKANGHMVGDDPTWKQYSRKCRALTAKWYGSAGEGYEWDHILPIVEGYRRGISPEEICSEKNIQKLTVFENRSKGTKILPESNLVFQNL